MSRISQKKSAGVIPLEDPVAASAKAPQIAARSNLESQPALLNECWLVPRVCLFLLAIVWVVFVQTLGFGFVNYDDNLYITDNPVVQKGLTLKGLYWALSYGEIGHWHPLTWVSHILDCQLYGLWAGGHHLTNVVLHGATVVCLFLVLRNMTGNLWRSAFVAAVWAVHPLRAESVAWVSERKDVLSGLFFVLTLGAYARYARKPSLPRYLGIAALFVLGLLSKNMLVTLPCLLLLLDYWPLRRWGNVSISRLLVEKIPFFALSAASCVMTFLVPEKGPVTDRMPLLLRLENAVVSCVIYIRQTIWPAHLAATYPNPQGLFPLWIVIAAIALLTGISISAAAARKNLPSLFVGWFWFLGMLIPVIGLVQISYYAHADRYTYLPQIGLCLATTWAVAGLGARLHWQPWVFVALSTGVIAALMMTARIQTAYWRDNETLWSHTLACTENNYIAQNNLGNALLEKGLLDAAVAHFQSALDINPGSAEPHNNLGNALHQEGHLDEAIAQYQKALDLWPSYAEAHYDLGNALSDKGQLDEAITHFQKALDLKPHQAKTYNNLALTLEQKGRLDEAIANYHKSLEFKPDFVEAQNNLANLLATTRNARLRNGVEALNLAQRANQLTGGNNPAILGTLAAAYAEQGRFPEAVETVQRAVQLAETQNNPTLSNFLRQHLKIYQAGKPLRRD